MKNYQIKDINGKILFESQAESLKACLEKAVEKETDLYKANFEGANLYRAKKGGKNALLNTILAQKISNNR